LLLFLQKKKSLFKTLLSDRHSGKNEKSTLSQKKKNLLFP